MLQQKPLVDSEGIENVQSADCPYYFQNVYMPHFNLGLNALSNYQSKTDLCLHMQLFHAE